MTYSRVGIFVHRTRSEARDLAQETQAWLAAHGISALFDTETATREGLPAFNAQSIAELDFIITLGGDGTILTAARLAAPHGIPILGVHLGRFGFIAETYPHALFPALERVLKNEVSIEERLMLEAEIWREEALIRSGVGLNDVMVKSGMSHLLRLKTALGGVEFATYPADGIVVATPTGSTAYALSAGGPFVMPTVQALILVPICPHTLNARPMVVPSTETIEIEVETDGDDILCAVDGVDAFPLKSHDRVAIHRATYSTRLITLEPATFYRKVRARYLYGERLNE